MCIAGGGVLNDAYSTLEEVKDLEKKGLMDNLPPNISKNAKFEIVKLHNNSANIQEYIDETNISLSYYENYLYIFTILFLLTIIFKVYFWIRNRTILLR
jgi:hypothetical protein